MSLNLKKHQYKAILFVVLIPSLFIILPACGSNSTRTPTAQSSPIINPEATVTPSPHSFILHSNTKSPTTTATISPQTNGFFTQDFTNGFIGWKYFFQGNTGTPANAFYSLQDGKLVFDMDAVNTGLYLIYQEHSYVNIQLMVHTENVGTRSSVSLVCGYSESNGWYEFNITSQGIYTLRHFDENGLITTIKQGGSKSINVGQNINEYTITCRASQSISLGVNGTNIIEVTDFKIPVGRAGIAVWVSDIHPIKVEVDQITFNNPN